VFRFTPFASSALLPEECAPVKQDHLIMPSSPEEKSSLPSPPAFGTCNAVFCALIFWAVSVGLQMHKGAFSADIGADPDEPAHAVTSLMVRDYLAVGLWKGEHPLHFAQRYYDHFPKVALGHYPPSFYLLAGAWLLPWPTKTALMLFIGMLSGVLGSVTAVTGYRCGLDKASAVIVGLWTLLLPITQKLSMLVMSDLLLSTLCLIAAGSFAPFLNKPTAGRALLFGVLASAAILTKASAIALALVPPLSILVMGRWRLCLDWRLWLAPLPVVVTAVPWTLLTMKITQEGMSGQSTAEYFPEAVKFYAGASLYTFGLLILIAALISIARTLPILWSRKRELNTCSVVMGAFGVSMLALYLVSPTGFSSRYFLPLAPLLLIAAAGSFRELRLVWNHRLASCAGIGAGAAASLLLLGPVQPKVASGFGLVADDLIKRSSGGKVLVSSDARGEGSLIAELAFRTTNRCQSSWTIVRSSKFMAASDWIGRDYKAAFTDREDFLSSLRRDRIAWIVEDRDIPADYQQPHHHQLQEWSGAIDRTIEVTSKREGYPKPGSIVLLHIPATEEGGKQ